MTKREDSALQQPSEVADALGISTAVLRRYAQAYEIVYGELPRDRRKVRLYTREAVERLEASRALVRQRRMPSIEAALRHLLEGGEGQSREPLSRVDGPAPHAPLLEELQRLREAVEEQNRKLASIESNLRRLPPSKAAEVPVSQDPDQAVADGHDMKPNWRRIGLATLLAGVIPVALATLTLGILFYRVGFAVNYYPYWTVFLFLSFVFHLLPFPLGVWAGLAWPGRHLMGHALLGLSAGAIEAIIDWGIMNIPGQPIVLGMEDFLTVIATAAFFTSGGLVGDLIERRGAPPSERESKLARQLANKVSGSGKEPSQNTLLLVQWLGPATIGLLGTLITALVTLLKE